MKLPLVRQILNVSKQRISQLVQNGKIKVAELPDGIYDYQKDDVLKYFESKSKREAEKFANLVINLTEVGDKDYIKELITNKLINEDKRSLEILINKDEDYIQDFSYEPEY